VRLCCALVALLLALTACSPSGGTSKGLSDNTGSGPYQGVGLVPPRPRPAFTLTDTSGATYPFAAKTQGKTTMLFFGYTNCPDICPATMADIGVALRAVPVATQKQITVVFVSTDVEHDTGPVIARWLANFSPDTHATFVGLRGTQAQVDAAQAASHIFLAEDGGQTHSTQVLLFGPDDYAHDSFVYNDNGEAKQMQHDLPLVVKGRT
jgi:protein SCO1